MTRKKKPTDLTISFPDEQAREHFLMWLSNQGEQNYRNDSNDHPDQVCFDYTHPLLKTFNPSRIRAERVGVLEDGGSFRQDNVKELVFQHLHKACALCEDLESKHLLFSGADLKNFDFYLEDRSWCDTPQWEVSEVCITLTDHLALLTQHLDQES
jgi:hypothetical protein